MKLIIPSLSPNFKLETSKVFKQLLKAHISLAELKGTAKVVSYEDILIHLLSIQEAKEYGLFDDIIVEHLDLFKENILLDSKNNSAKKIYKYARSSRLGYHLQQKDKSLLNKHLLAIHNDLFENNKGYRIQLESQLINPDENTDVSASNEYKEFVSLMNDLEKYINDDSLSNLDPLIKMGIIYYQVLNIQPMYIGNEKIARMICILYLIQKDLLTIPVLSISAFFSTNKEKYYKILEEVRSKDDWENFLLFFLNAIDLTAKQGIAQITEINNLLLYYKDRISAKLPRVYSEKFVHAFFKSPYTKANLLANDIKISKQTALNYLDAVVRLGLLKKIKVKKTNHYINYNLLHILEKYSTKIK